MSAAGRHAPERRHGAAVPDDSAACDYLLVVGPGRSGSEFLYRRLKGHPAYAFPEIKEGYYYRSPRAFRKARARAGGRVLVDVANLGYRDAALAPGVRALLAEGVRVLLVVLLRDHRERARSMIAFRRSRGEVSALLGARRLEAAVVADRLTPARLRAIHALDADVLALCFDALTADATAALDCLAALCGTAPFADGADAGEGAVNEAVRARVPPFAAAGKLAALALRRLGLRRTLQRLKDSRRLRTFFFAPLDGADAAPPLSDASARLLDECGRECRAAVAEASERLRPGVFLRRAPGMGA